MTPTLSSRARGALGAAVLVAGVLLTGAPSAGAAPTTDAVNTINDRYAAFGGQGSLLGAPIGEAVDVPGGAERDYEGGAIYYSKDTGAHVMYGAILERYRDLGGPASELGYPKNDESDTGDGTGRFNDFSTPGGASIYWTPQWGASVVKGRVLEAWRQSGGITGPFGYPSADTSILDGVQTGKFAGPDGSEIQWSEAGGLVTVPAELAAKLPGFGAAPPPPPPVATTTAEGTTSVMTPEPAAPEKSTSSKKWWWIPIGLLAAALGGLLLKLLRRRPEPEPVRVTRAPEVRKAVTPVAKTVPPPPRPAPVKAPPAPPAPPVIKAPPPAPKPVVPPAPPKPVTPPPPRVTPLAKVPPPPPAPKPVVRAVPEPTPVVETPKPVAPEPPKVVRPVVVPEPPKVVRPAAVPEPPKPVVVPDPPKVVRTEPVRVEPAKVVHTETVVHTEPVVHTESVVHHTTSVEHEASAVIRYESHTPTETTIQVTYENNAVGDHQESRADKSDSIPD